MNHAWAVLDPSEKEYVIPEAEKAIFRERLLPIMASAEGLVRPQLIPILQRILHYDFPERWPSFLDFTLQLLNTNDTRSVLTGLECLLAICRTYRYKSSDSESRGNFDKIIEASFPRMLSICNELVNQESDEASEMLHLALKCYKHATWVRCFLLVYATVPWKTNLFIAGAVALPARAEPEPRLVHRFPGHHCQSSSC